MDDLKICDCRDPNDPDLCARHPFYLQACKVTFSEDELPTVIQDEIFWGYGIRDDRKKRLQAKGVPPKESPYEFPFAICRAMGIPCKKKKKKWVCPAIPKKITLEDKWVMTQQEYCNYLSQPTKKKPCEPWKPIKRKRCEIEPCPPRFVQLAIPHKRRVFWNWKCFYRILTTEMILRLEQLLHTDKNLDPRDARWYYKKLDKLKKRCIKHRKKLRRNKLKERDAGSEKWLEENIKCMAHVITDYIRDEPLYALNYKQLLLSDAILTKLDERKFLKKPKRNTKNHYKRTLVEISDKVAVWMDTITRFVDIQAIEDLDDIPPLTISSVSDAEEEEEGETEEEDEMKQEEEGELDLWGILEHLIRIYKTRTPPDYMQNTVGPMPWIKYIDILEALIWLRNLLLALGPPPPPGLLEQTLIDWLKEVSPDKINEKTLKQIHDYACAIADKLNKHGFKGDETPEPGSPPAEEEATPPAIKSPCKTPPKTPPVEQEEPPLPPPMPETPPPAFEPCTCVEEGDRILGHKPSLIKNHSPDAICCLSLKIWAVWLLEVCHNAHIWTKWMHEVIRQIREFAATVRGDIKLPNGQTKVLYKEEWRQFLCETEEKIVYWMDYSMHVKELSDSIIENFKGKPVYCCPKCLQDHLIRNVVSAHETLGALTDAMNMAQYWRKCLDSLVATTAALTDLDDLESSSDGSVPSAVDIMEFDCPPPCRPRTGQLSGDDQSLDSTGSYRLLQMDPRIQKPDCDCID